EVLMPVFWVSKGMIHIDFLKKGITIKGAYYANLLEKVRAGIKEKLRGLLARRQRLLQDKSPSQNSHIVGASDRKCGFKILFFFYPLYSHATTNYLEILKNTIRGHFASNNELIWAAESCLQGQNEGFFWQGIKALKNRWEEFNLLEDAYVE
ncbi:hypothetical protein CAPTEDRAFT_137176, partial [Capitella teleta]